MTPGELAEHRRYERAGAQAQELGGALHRAEPRAREEPLRHAWPSVVARPALPRGQPGGPWPRGLPQAPHRERSTGEVWPARYDGAEHWLGVAEHPDRVDPVRPQAAHRQHLLPHVRGPDLALVIAPWRALARSFPFSWPGRRRRRGPAQRLF